MAVREIILTEQNRTAQTRTEHNRTAQNSTLTAPFFDCSYS